MSNFTVDQEKIINSPVTNMLVSAGAGCGKSTVLTARIIKRISEGDLSLKNLIVLSFTNASANDIREKIKKALKNKMNEVPSLVDEYEYVAQADISTFDSLCHNYFKKYSYKLNLKKDINIIDNTQFKFIIENIINEILLKYYDNPKFIKLLDKITLKDDKGFINALINFYLSYVDKVVDPYLFLDDMINITKDSSVNVINNYKEKKDNIISEIKRFYYDCPFSDMANEILMSHINEILNAKDSLDLEEFNFDSNLPDLKKSPFNKGDDKIYYSELRKILLDYKAKFNRSIKSIKEELDESIEYAYIIKDMCIEILNEYKEYCRNYNAFTFNDVAKMVIKIFKENDDILNDVKNNIKEIYVDEYQDTSNIQEELINLISDNNLIVVGDVKQSIYRFRDANPDIFKNKFIQYGNNNGGVRVDLKHNFRSRVEVLASINDIFDLLMTNDFDGIDYKNEHRLIAGRDKFSSTDPGIEFYYENITNGEEKLSKNEICNNTFLTVLKDIKYKMDNDKSLNYKDFAIIVRNKNHFNDYSKIAESKNIPLVCEASKPFIRNTEIMAFNSIISFLVTKDDLYKVSIMRSFLFDFNDEEIFNAINGNSNERINEFDEKIKNIMIKKDYITLYDLINEIYDVFGFFKLIYKLDDPIGAEKRLLYLLKNSITYMNLGWTYYELNDFMNKMSNSDSRKELDIEYDSNDVNCDNAVSLITIHKSKGLEYDYIYFIETDTAVGKSDDAVISFNKNVGIAFKPSLSDSFIPKLVKENNGIEQLYEDLRLLYVCLTRAKKGIIVFTRSEKYGDNTVLNSSVSKNTKLEYSSFDDMLMSAFESYKSEEIKDVEFEGRTYVSKDIDISFNNIDVDIKLYNDNKASHGISNLIDKKTAEALAYGTRLHEILEYNNFNLDNDNEIINKFKNNLKLMVKDKIINYYPEYEFKLNDTTGSIDLLVETLDSFVVIDYKSSDIEKDYYIKQVKTYMDEIKKRSAKKVYGFLYSLEKGIYKEI